MSDESAEGVGPGAVTGAGGSPESTTVTGAGGSPESTTVTGAGGSPESTTVTGAGGGGPGEPSGDAFALFNEEITTLTPEAKQAWLDAGEMLDPQTLILSFIEAGTRTCSDPAFEGLGGENHRQTLIGLPPALQKAGRYEFSSTDVIAYRNEWLSSEWGGGGGGERPLTEGTIEVLSIDDAAITVRLSAPSLDGDYVVRRCP
ncbi:hypothetical protein WMF30_24790 [Sorangium sp. So ce134]